MSDKTKQLGIAVFGIGAVLITLMMLLAKGCEDTDNKRLECVKAGHSPTECSCLFDKFACSDRE